MHSILIGVQGEINRIDLAPTGEPWSISEEAHHQARRGIDLVLMELHALGFPTDEVAT